MKLMNQFLLTTFAVSATFAVAIGDVDGDGVPDSTEQMLLSAFAPIWKADRLVGVRPPLPVEWWVRHCELRITDLLQYNLDGYNGRSLYLYGPARTRCTVPDLTVALVNSVLEVGDFPCGDLNGVPPFYLLGAKQDRYRDGNDPNDPITWDRMNAEQRCVYGRVSPLGTSRYLVQYFMFFGNNTTDTPGGTGIRYGEHQGDWICVEFEVLWDGSTPPRVERAVYNNHGRKVFVDSPAGIDWQNSRPVVYLEIGTQEPLPWPGDCGFFPGQPVPRCVGTNEVKTGFEAFGWRFGSECEDFQVVRQHSGNGFVLDVTSVINLGERNGGWTSPEVEFIHIFPGRYGWFAEDRICVPLVDCFWGNDIPGVTIPGVQSPKAPPYQEKMWDRAGNDDPRVGAWPGTPPRSLVFASATGSSDPDGSEAAPFRGLFEGLPVVAPGGTLQLSPGDYQAGLTIIQSVTITSSGGTATVGGP
ncbi:MAG: hypothetical protein Kow0022_06720 [Phycisphaerales bacterium]